jgi:hypothetical protein
MDERLQLDYKNYIKPIHAVRASQTWEKASELLNHLWGQGQGHQKLCWCHSAIPMSGWGMANQDWSKKVDRNPIFLWTTQAQQDKKNGQLSIQLVSFPSVKCELLKTDTTQNSPPSTMRQCKQINYNPYILWKGTNDIRCNGGKELKEHEYMISHGHSHF